MNLFDLPQAEHFCAPLSAGTPTMQQSLHAFHSALTRQVLHEGSTEFDVHRTNVLKSAEQWILYSVTNYRRAVEMLVPGSAPWAHVTLYYSSFYAANAVLAMFGGWIAVTSQGERVVEVEDGTPHSQRLRVHRRLRSPNRVRGSHRQFWDFFYDAAASLVAWTPGHLLPALAPSTGDYDWQIVPRNEVNYDMFHAWNSSAELDARFDRRNLETLTGRLALQLEATEYMVRLAQYFADELSLHSFGIVGNNDGRSRRQTQRRLATQRPPNMWRQSAFKDMVVT